MATSAVEELLAEGWPIAEDRIHDCFGNDALTDVLTLRRKMLDVRPFLMHYFQRNANYKGSINICG